MNTNKTKRISNRSIQHDLRFLRGLDLIELDNAEYSLKVGQKKFSKGDHELALKHSRKLLESLTERSVHIHLWLDLLVFDNLGAESLEHPDEMCLLQHLKSGYYQDIYERMLEYRNMMKETGLAESDRYPILGHTNDLKDILMKSEKPPPRVRPFPSSSFVTVESEALKKIIDLRDLLIGKLISIEHSVKHLTPLKGSCEYCPHLKIKIIE